MNFKIFVNNLKWNKTTKLRRSKANLFELDLIFFPTNINSSYCAFAVVSMVEKVIKYYDFLNSGSDLALCVCSKGKQFLQLSKYFSNTVCEFY